MEAVFRHGTGHCSFASSVNSDDPQISRLMACFYPQRDCYSYMPGESRMITAEILRASKPVEYDFLPTSFNVPPHRCFADSASWRLIATNPPVAGERFLRPPFHLHRPLPRVAQQVHENISTFSTTLLPEARAMPYEIPRLRQPWFRTCKLDLLALQISSISEISSGRSVGRGARRQWRFQHLTKIKKFADQSLLYA